MTPVSPTSRLPYPTPDPALDPKLDPTSVFAMHTKAKYCSDEFSKLKEKINEFMNALYTAYINGGPPPESSLRNAAKKLMEEIKYVIERCGDNMPAADLNDLRDTLRRLEDFLGSNSNEITFENLLKALAAGFEVAAKLLRTIISNVRLMPNP